MTERRLVQLWMNYQGSGSPYGNTFEGFIEWLKDRIVQDEQRTAS